jgi:hypothetical protein
MIADLAIAKQPRQQGQGVLRKGRVYKWLLPFQASHSAATRFAVIVETRVHYLRK